MGATASGQHFFEPSAAAPVQRIAPAEAGDNGTRTRDDFGVLSLQGRWIEGRRCAEALRGGDEREPAAAAESGDADRTSAVGPLCQEFSCRRDVVEGAALTGHEIVEH
jgi:hypothetical protein